MSTTLSSPGYGRLCQAEILCPAVPERPGPAATMNCALVGMIRWHEELVAAGTWLVAGVSALGGLGGTVVCVLGQ